MNSTVVVADSPSASSSLLIGIASGVICLIVLLGVAAVIFYKRYYSGTMTTLSEAKNQAEGDDSGRKELQSSESPERRSHLPSFVSPLHAG